MQTKRIYMNEADGSPGNGAPVAPPAPAEPQAQAAPVPDLSQLVSQIVAQVSTTVDEKLTAQENKIFANLRKSGALGKDKPADDKPAPQPAAAPASPGLSPADVKVMIERTRAVDRAVFEHKLTDAQTKRMTAAMEAEAPPDAVAWAKSYLADMGLVRSTEVAPSPAPVPNAAPISDKGSPAPGGAVAWEREYAENPIGMSPAAFALMVAKHGHQKAWQMRIEASKEQAARIRVTR